MPVQVGPLPDRIDFGEACWRDVSEQLLRLGFAELRTQHADYFREVPRQQVVCERVSEMLGRLRQNKDAGTGAHNHSCS